MRRKIILRLSLVMVLLCGLQSCVHDEVYSSSDPASKEYHSKSLWKEDEKYIKNVIDIYTKHEKEIRKPSGIPDWDYAMSMEKYDESFMVVPIIENRKVVNTLVCARFDKKVYFRYENSESNKAFFPKYYIWKIYSVQNRISKQYKYRHTKRSGLYNEKRIYVVS